MLRRWTMLVCLLGACGGEALGPDGGTQDTEAGTTRDAAAPDAGVTDPPPDAAGGPCPCFVGDGPYCAGRAAAMAAEAGCELPLLEGHEDDLLSCAGDVWSVAEGCAERCAYTAEATELDDACVLPECECFVLEAYCGSGAQEIAEERGCSIPLIPEHYDDILHCPGGNWAVRDHCSDGCHSAPRGQPDFCVDESDYLLPFVCGKSVRCSSGNNTSNHNGKDAYAFDFAVERGTSVRAIRSGTVLRVRNVSSPGDACYGGGGSACANLANTVEVKHSDGTVALYMHLNRGTVRAGDTVAQGDEIGKSGNSGWSTGPHLHIQVQRDCGIWWCQSVRFTFGEDNTIASGTNVTSANCQ